jgi:hypothetical protein
LCFWCFLFWLGALQVGGVHGPRAADVSLIHIILQFAPELV